MIAIIDYGMGNLASVYKAMLYIGQEAEVTSDPKILLNADAAILPGVGAISNAMANLRSSGLADAVREVVSRQKPLLGICLGMQMLFETSEEGEDGRLSEGLGLFKGRVRKIPSAPAIKIPHMGWNTLAETRGSLLKEGSSVYFVHSYYAEPDDPALATSKVFHGTWLTASVAKGRVDAMQFHPEKSGDTGLDILRRWVRTF